MPRAIEEHAEASDEMLMVRYQRGNRDAFAALVGRHGASLYSFACYLLSDDTRAKDVVRQTFRHLANNAANFHLEAHFRSWLYSAVHQIVTDPQRSVVSPDADWGHRFTVATEATPSSGMQPPSSRVQRSLLLLRRVASCVAALPFDAREALLLKHVAQLSLNSLADIMSIDSDTARHLIRVALEKLQDGVADTEEYARALR